MHEPLSLRLAQILKETPTSGGVTMNYLLARTEGRGLYLLFILLCLPFVPLVSPPGLSSLLGGIVLLLSLSVAIGARPQLPRCVGERPLPPAWAEQLRELLEPASAALPRPRARGFRQHLVSGGVKFLRFIERWCRPRRTAWLGWRVARIGNALLIALMAALLALPLPSAPVFPTNGLPAYAIILLAAAVMEEDGVLIWFGYAVSLATIAFFASIAGVIAHFFEATWTWLLHWGAAS